MAAENLGELVVKVSTDLTNLNKGLSEASQKVSDTSEKMNVSIARVASGVAIAGGAILAAFGAMIKSAVDYGDEIYEVSKRTGIATETLSRLKFVAEQTESSFEAVTTGLRFLNKNLFEAANGNKELEQTFKTLGISTVDASGKVKNAEVAFLEIADAFNRIEDNATKTAVAMQIFGRGGQALIPILELGSEGIKKLSDQADKLGLTLTKENAVAIDEFSDKIKELKASFGGLALSVGNAFIPALTNLINFIQQSVNPVLEGLRIQLGGVKEQMLETQQQQAFNSGDKVLDNAMRELVLLREKRSELEAIAQTSGGRGSQQEAITVLDEQIKRVELLALKRREEFEQHKEMELRRIDIVKKSSNEEVVIKAKDFEKKKTLDYDYFASLLGNLSMYLTQAGEKNKAAAVAAKVINLQLAIMNTAVGVARAFKDYIWPYSAVVAALVGAAGAVQIATIASTGFAEGTDTVPSMLSPGEMVVPRTFADAIRTGDLTLGGRDSVTNNNNNAQVSITVNAVIEHPVDIQRLAEELAFQTQRELRYVR